MNVSTSATKAENFQMRYCMPRCCNAQNVYDRQVSTNCTAGFHNALIHAFPDIFREQYAQLVVHCSQRTNVSGNALLQHTADNQDLEALKMTGIALLKSPHIHLQL